MEPLKLSDLPVDSVQLTPRTLEELAPALRKGLIKNYADVHVEIAECPDLTCHPYNLAGAGIGGNAWVVQVGDPGYVIPNARYDKVYSFKDIAKIAGLSKGFIMGCGGGPLYNQNSFYEMVANVSIDEGEIKCFTKNVCTVDKQTQKVRTLITPPEECRFACIANLFCCEGTRDKILKVTCEKRIGPDNFPKAVCNSLKEEFEEPVGLGMVFDTVEGAVQHYVAAGYPKDVTNLIEWVTKPLLQSPIVSVGTIVTKNPHGFPVLADHFHSYTHGNTSGGHYLYDTTPEIIKHVAYISVANTLCIVDKAERPRSLFS